MHRRNEMGFFDIFKKKKKVKQLSEDALKWNKMWDLWVNDKIESPYKELMEYSSGVNNGGHHCHLDNIYGNQDLTKYVEQLSLILDEPLKSNIQKAFKAYMENPEEASDDNVQILEDCDSLFYKYEENINDILKERAKKIQL